jgi:hypothetical protein
MVLLGAAGLCVGPAAPAVHTQEGVLRDTLVFEHVGDRPIDPEDLAFDDTGALWAIDADIWRLAPGATAWEEIGIVSAVYILPLGPDTLVVGGFATRRSVDGGESFSLVHDEGEALFEAATSGTLLTGTKEASGVAYSEDRGATWADGVLDAGTWVPEAAAFAELPPGHGDAGRLVAGCWGGLSYSDDGGRTWAKSSLWQDSGRYLVSSVAVGVDGRVYAAFTEVGVAGTQVAASADGGQTYEVIYGFGVPLGTKNWIVALPGGADPEVGVLVVVQHDGSVWRSDDAAASWRQVGQVPVGSPPRMDDVLVGPDGRLYAGTTRSGDAEGWVWRTTGPVVTAAEPGSPDQTRMVLEVAPNPFRGGAEVALTLREPSWVRLAVFDVLGREVAVLADGPMTAGTHALAFDGVRLQAGVYIVRVEAVGTVASRTVTLVR